MDKELRDWDELGVLKLGTSITIGNFLLPTVLNEVKTRHPHLKIKARIANGYSLEQALIHDQLDFAVIEGTVTDPQLSTEVFASDRLVPILPPDSPLKGQTVMLDDLIKSPLLLREKGSAGRSLVWHRHKLLSRSAKEAMDLFKATA